MNSYFNPETDISILVPEEWTGQIINQQQFRIFSTEEPDFNNYRSTMSYIRSEPEGYDLNWFEQLITQLDENVWDENNEFKLIKEERLILSSLAYTYIRWYEWQDPNKNLHFFQIQSLIFAKYIYVVNAATLHPLKDKYVPIFESILKSTRIIPNA